MAWSRTKLMTSVALFGFLMGAIVYFAFEWLINNGVIYIASVPISGIIFSPWFISGIAGALISLIAIYTYAYFSPQK